MRSTPYFSIVIPCLNEEKSISGLLRDLITQSYQDFEVYVVDGKSEDKTIDIVQKFIAKDERIHLLTADKRNAGYQRNFGFQKSKGSYVVFFDADNRLPKYYLAGIHYQSAKLNPDLFSTYMESDTENTQDILFVKLSNIIIDQAAKIGSPLAYGSCIGCKRQIFKELGGFDAELTYGEDTEFVKRATKHEHSFQVFHEPTYIYSLRRFRKEGTMKFLRQFTPIALKLIKNERLVEPLAGYPMLGGSYFDQEIQKQKKSTRTLKQLQLFAKSVREILAIHS